MDEEKIVSGGGWKEEPASTPVYIGAVSCLLLVCLCGILALLHTGAIRWVASAVGVLLFILAIILSHLEKPIGVPDPPGCGDDPYCLYIRDSVSTSEQDSRQEPGPHPLDAGSKD